MHCSIERKIVPFGKTLYGGSLKNLMSLGGQEENVSGKANSPRPPRDFINERSLNHLFNIQELR